MIVYLVKALILFLKLRNCILTIYSLWRTNYEK